MSDQTNKDRISLGLLAGQAVVVLGLLIISLLNIRSQELLIEFRFNFLRGFVEKTDWFVLYTPALIVLLILGVNFFIFKWNKDKVQPLVLHLYLAGSVLVQLLTLIVVISMHTAVGL